MNLDNHYNNIEDYQTDDSLNEGQTYNQTFIHTLSLREMEAGPSVQNDTKVLKQLILLQVKKKEKTQKSSLIYHLSSLKEIVSNVFQSNEVVTVLPLSDMFFISAKKMLRKMNQAQRLKCKISDLDQQTFIQKQPEKNLRQSQKTIQQMIYQLIEEQVISQYSKSNTWIYLKQALVEEIQKQNYSQIAQNNQQHEQQLVLALQNYFRFSIQNTFKEKSFISIMQLVFFYNQKIIDLLNDIAGKKSPNCVKILKIILKKPLLGYTLNLKNQNECYKLQNQDQKLNAKLIKETQFNLQDKIKNYSKFNQLQQYVQQFYSTIIESILKIYGNQIGLVILFNISKNLKQQVQV